MQAELARLSQTDALTGLANRRRFEEAYARACADAATHGQAALAARRRCRPLQALQRPLRPCGRRRGAQGRSPAALRERAPARRPRLPGRRRGVRPPAAGHRRGRGALRVAGEVHAQVSAPGGSVRRHRCRRRHRQHRPRPPASPMPPTSTVAPTPRCTRPRPAGGTARATPPSAGTAREGGGVPHCLTARGQGLRSGRGPDPRLGALRQAVALCDPPPRRHPCMPSDEPNPHRPGRRPSTVTGRLPAHRSA